MEKFDAAQTPDPLGGKTTHNERIRDLTELELNEVSGGPGPPGTAGDGNGRVGRTFATTFV